MITWGQYNEQCDIPGEVLIRGDKREIGGPSPQGVKLEKESGSCCLQPVGSVVLLFDTLLPDDCVQMCDLT